MFQIYENTIIYVLCPAHIVTGGIEAVHQLVDKLRKFGHRAMIVPTPIVSNPYLLQYRNYDVEFTSHIADSERNILITSEVNPRALDSCTSIQKGLWWLSVDNHEKLTDRFEFHNPKNKDVVHLAQSTYAHAFLKGKGVTNIHYLSDYLHDAYMQRSRTRKKDLVLYTPIKGADTYVNELIHSDPSIQWLPLKGMIRKKHALTLRQGKVYVDFGSHPGKDRQPREAAVNGCCVLVGRRGSANFREDVPIPDDYKFAVATQNGSLVDSDKILETIRTCLREYNKTIKDFSAYAEAVRQEEQRFEAEIMDIFGPMSLTRRRANITRLRNTLRFSLQNNAITVLRGLANEFFPLAPVDAARQLYLSLIRTSSR